MKESSEQFENRKKDHIRYALDSKNEATGHSGLDQVSLWHDALPEIDADDVSIESEILGLKLKTPLFVCSMTAGHQDSTALNRVIAELCADRGWMMGVGSQRRELNDPAASNEWKEIRKASPTAILLGNIGLSQLIRTPVDAIQRLAENLEASAMIVHTNPLQEFLQPEGTPQFRGGINAIQTLAETLEIPVVVKETGCGFSPQALEKLRNNSIAALDVSGFGGTHWGRIEGDRNEADTVRAKAAATFAHWGVSTAESASLAVEKKLPFEIWGSGGVRSGLDAAKLLAMGVNAVGFAKPILASALNGAKALEAMMQTIEFELRCALFCTGCATIEHLRERDSWRWITKK